MAWPLDISGPDLFVVFLMSKQPGDSVSSCDAKCLTLESYFHEGLPAEVLSIPLQSGCFEEPSKLLQVFQHASTAE